MIIKIAYESKFSLSTVRDGEVVIESMANVTANANKNSKYIFQKDKSFLENVKNLSSYYPNYRYADITQDTVLGILCRLTGEVRRLDSLNDSHPIVSLKDKISFENKNSDFQNEVMLISSKLNEVQNNAGGLIDSKKQNHFLLSNNPLSQTLLNVFQQNTQMKIVALLDAMKNNDEKFFYSSYDKTITVSSFIKEHILSEQSQKDIIKGFNYTDGENRLKEIDGRLFYGDTKNVEMLENYILTNKEMESFKSSNITDERKRVGVNEIFNIYGFLFAKKIVFLQKNGLFANEFKSSLNNEKSSIKGLAPGSGSLTIKDYYSNFVKDKKMSWTLPYSVELKKELFSPEELNVFNFGVKLGVTKECGELVIKIDVDKQEELMIYEKIEQSGVNTFHLGKKGLAYVSEIQLER